MKDIHLAASSVCGPDRVDAARAVAGIDGIAAIVFWSTGLRFLLIECGDPGIGRPAKKFDTVATATPFQLHSAQRKFSNTFGENLWQQKLEHSFGPVEFFPELWGFCF